MSTLSKIKELEARIESLLEKAGECETEAENKMKDAEDFKAEAADIASQIKLAKEVRDELQERDNAAFQVLRIAAVNGSFTPADLETLRISLEIEPEPEAEEESDPEIHEAATG